MAHADVLLIGPLGAVLRKPIARAHRSMGLNLRDNLSMTIPSHSETLVLGGGCFWCTEAVYVQVKGVLDVESGYCNGRTINPTYEQVCGGDTGHNEVVKLTYDPEVISTRVLLEIFFVIHDPTTLNRQGNDRGTQYRSAIFVMDDDDLAVVTTSAEQYQKALAKAGFGQITTEIAVNDQFYYAEDYHQQYLHKVPNGYCGLQGTGVSAG